MAQVIRYINTASTPGGDGITNATTGANRAYAGMTEWNTNEQTDLVTAGDFHLVNCTGTTSDAGDVQIDGWTTGASNYIEIVGEWETGTYDTNKYRVVVVPDSDDDPAITIFEEFVRIKKLQIFVNHGATTHLQSHGIYVAHTGTGDVRIEKTIIRFDNDATVPNNTYGIRGSGPGVLYVTNCVIYGLIGSSTFNAGIMSSNISLTLHAYSCTLADNDYGIRAHQGTINAKNCYAGGSSYQDYKQESGATLNLTTCSSSDTTGSAGLQNIALSTSSGAYLTNLTAGSEDYHITSSSELIDVGTDTSGESAPLDFTDDFEGTTRGASWDIGADEFLEVTKSGSLTFMGANF